MQGIQETMQELRRQREAIEEALSALEKVFGEEANATSAPSATVKATAPTEAKRKGGITPAGRKRLAEKMKQIWAAKRAAGTASRPKKRKLSAEGRANIVAASKRMWAAKRAAAKKAK